MTTHRSDLPRETETVIIGGGIAGVATAYFLAQAGVPVVLCEKGRIAGEQSSRNWGWVRKQGRDPRELPAIIESLKIWENLERDLGADIGWHRGGVTYLARSEDDLAGFEGWLKLARPYQLDSRLLSPQETARLIGDDDSRWAGALFTASDGRAEPAKVVPAMARKATELGARILANCAVRTVETAAGRVAGVVTEHGPIACRSVVCAAGAWSGLFNGNLGIRLPQLAVRASVLRTTPAPPITQSAVWSGEIAFRRRQDGGYTIARRGATVFDIVPDAFRHFRAFLPALRANREEMRFRLNRTFFEALWTPKRWTADEVTPFERTRVLDPAPDRGGLIKAIDAARRFSKAWADIGIADAWAGMIDVTPDALPVIDALAAPQGYFIATGFSGHGFGMGPAAGLLMSELVQKGSARVDLTPFRLDRFTDGTPMMPYSAI